MAIYLDTNVLRGLLGADGVDRASLSVVATQLTQQIVVPSLVVEEAAAARRRDLQTALDEHDQALNDIRRQFGVTARAEFEPHPDVDEAIEAWLSRLHEWAWIIPTTVDHMVEGVRREIERRAPVVVSKNERVTGARDAAIWATIRDHHQKTDEIGHFVSNDGDFAEGKPERLKSDLIQECGQHAITLHKHVGSIVQQLGAVTSTKLITLDELHDKAAFAVIYGLEGHPGVGRAVLDSDSRTWTARADIEVINPTEVIATRTYAAESSSIRIADAIWDVKAKIVGQRRGSSMAYTLATTGLRVRALVSIADNESRLLEADVESETTSVNIRDNDDGSIEVSSWGNPQWHLNRHLETD